MKLRVSRPAAWTAAFTAAAARVFYALAVETGPVHNGVWLSALLGAAISMPILALLERLRKRSEGVPRTMKKLLMLAPCLAALVDSGLSFSAIVRASSFLAMDDAATAILVVPVALALFWCVSRNGDAIGYAAMLWTRVFPALIVLVALLQWRHFRPRWLLPLLGGGWPSIWNGGLRTACCFLPIAALALVCEEEEDAPRRKHPPAAAISGGAALAALMLLPRLMMAPTALADGGWYYRLDTLLTNGRAPLYLQLPLIVLWYAGLFHLLASETFVAALLSQRLLPGLDGRLCALSASIVATAIGCSSLPISIPDGRAPLWLLMTVAALSLFAMLLSRKTKGGRRPCGQ